MCEGLAAKCVDMLTSEERQAAAILEANGRQSVCNDGTSLRLANSSVQALVCCTQSKQGCLVSGVKREYVPFQSNAPTSFTHFISSSSAGVFLSLNCRTLLGAITTFASGSAF